MKDYLSEVLELIAYAKKALPADDFNDVEVDYRSDDLYYFSNIKDSIGNERRLNVQTRRLGGPAMTDADTGERY